MKTEYCQVPDIFTNTVEKEDNSQKRIYIYRINLFQRNDQISLSQDFTRFILSLRQKIGVLKKLFFHLKMYLKGKKLSWCKVTTTIQYTIGHIPSCEVGPSHCELITILRSSAFSQGMSPSRSYLED